MLRLLLHDLQAPDSLPDRHLQGRRRDQRRVPSERQHGRRSSPVVNAITQRTGAAGLPLAERQARTTTLSKGQAIETSLS